MEVTGSFWGPQKALKEKVVTRKRRDGSKGLTAESMNHLWRLLNRGSRFLNRAAAARESGSRGIGVP